MDKPNVFKSDPFYMGIGDQLHILVDGESDSFPSIDLHGATSSEPEKYPTSLLKTVLVRNRELDNSLSLASSSKLTITTKTGQVLTVDNLPDYNRLDDNGWVAMLCDFDKTNGSSDPSTDGDYLYKSLCTVDRVAKTLTFGASVSLSAWEVGDTLVLYNPFLNYTFVGDQTANSILPTISWADVATQSGIIFKHSDGRYIWMYGGTQSAPSKTQFGYMFSYDMNAWFMGNSGNPVFDCTTIPDCNHATIVGPVYPVNDGTGRYYCTIHQTKISTGWGIPRIFYFDEDLTTFSWSTQILPNTDPWFGGNVCPINGTYYFITLRVSLVDVPHRMVAAYKSPTLEGTYTWFQDIADGFTANDGVAYSNGVDQPNMCYNGITAWGLMGATAKWAKSGTKGNREFVLLNFDIESETWSIDKRGPIILNPMYFHNLPAGEYLWAGDHCGGYPSVFLEGGDTYMSLTMRGSIYVGTIIKLNLD